jgi:hypothetical protein
MVAEHRNLRHPDLRQQFAGQFDLGNLSAFGEVAGDDQEIGRTIDRTQVGQHLMRNVRTQVQVTNCGKPDRPPRVCDGFKCVVG